MAHNTKFERRNSQGKRQEFVQAKTGNLPEALAKPHASKGKYNLISFTGDEHKESEKLNKRQLAALRKAKAKRDNAYLGGKLSTNWKPFG